VNAFGYLGVLFAPLLDVEAHSEVEFLGLARTHVYKQVLGYALGRSAQPVL